MLGIKEILKASKGQLVYGPGTGMVSGVSTDTRTIRPGDLFIALKGRNFNGHEFIEEAVRRGANAVLTQLHTPASPARLTARLTLPCRQAGVGQAGRQYSCLSGRQAILNTSIIQVKDTLTALGDIAHYYRMKFDIPLIGITGSNGKTTAKEMVYRVLDAKFRVLKNEGTQNNLIGVPQTLLKLKSGHDIAVMEMGTNHFGEIKRLSNILSPSVGIITNIGASHLEFLDSESGVLREKMALPRSLKKNNIAILNADDRMLSRARNLKCRVIRFGIGNESDFTATDIIRKDNEMDFMVNNEYPFRLRLLGEHNIYNALIAITIGFLCRIEHRRIYNALYEFEPVKGRLCLRVAGGIHIIDDTYNSNPCSLKTAVTTLSGYRCAGRKIFIFGDMLELGPAAHRFHHEAGRLVSGAGIHCLISVGSFGDIVRDSALSGGMGKETVFSCRDNASVLAVLKKIIREDDAVLLKGSRLLKLDEVVNALLSSIPSKRDMVRL